MFCFCSASQIVPMPLTLYNRIWVQISWQLIIPCFFRIMCIYKNDKWIILKVFCWIFTRRITHLLLTTDSRSLREERYFCMQMRWSRAAIGIPLITSFIIIKNRIVIGWNDFCIRTSLNPFIEMTILVMRVTCELVNSASFWINTKIKTSHFVTLKDV